MLWATSSNIYVAEYIPSTGWDDVQVIHSGITVCTGSGKHPTIRIDDVGNLFVAWLTNATCAGSVRVKANYKPFGGSWQTESFIDDGGTANFNTLKIAATGTNKNMVTFQKSGSPALYAYYDGAVWQKGSLDATGSSYVSKSLKILDSGKAYACIQNSRDRDAQADAADAALELYEWDGASWTSKGVMSAIFLDGPGSEIIHCEIEGKENNIAITWTIQTGSHKMHMITYDGATLSTSEEIITLVGNTSEGAPHLALVANGINYDAKYIYLTDDASTEPVAHNNDDVFNGFAAGQWSSAITQSPGGVGLKEFKAVGSDIVFVSWVYNQVVYFSFYK